MFNSIKKLTALGLAVTMMILGAGTAFAEESKGPGISTSTEASGSNQAADTEQTEEHAVSQTGPSIHYSVLPRNSSDWSETANDGEVTDIGGPASKALTSFKANVQNVNGGVEYRVYLNQGGWQPWTPNNEPTTAPAEDIQIEAIQMRLTGEVSNFLDIYYSTQVSQAGQLDWAKNGQISGSMALGQYIEEIKVRLIAKTDPAPGATENLVFAPYKEGLQYVDNVLRFLEPDGTTYTGWIDIDGSRYYINDSYPLTGWQYLDGYKLYFAEDGKLVQNLEPIIGAQSSYHLKINKQMNCLTVYAKDGAGDYIIPVRSMLCSTGEDTPLGTSKTNQKYRWHLMNGGVYTQYATRIIPNTGFMLHSIIYEKPDNQTMRASTYNRLGVERSAGCIRLTSEDSKWIYDNCKLGTVVTIYDSPVPGPYYRPSVKPIPNNQTWDPTDVTAPQALELMKEEQAAKAAAQGVQN